MTSNKVVCHQSYRLGTYQKQMTGPDQLPVQRFTLQALSGEERWWEFDTLEQVMNFLLDQLLEDGEDLSRL